MVLSLLTFLNIVESRAWLSIKTFETIHSVGVHCGENGSVKRKCMELGWPLGRPHVPSLRFVHGEVALGVANQHGHQAWKIGKQR